jgi:predicted transposase YbfD/YdcC
LQLLWLRRFLPFANEIASHDTFSRVFSLLDARQFEVRFVQWMRELCPSLHGQLVPIDGKSVRSSHDGDEGAIHLVSAWNHGAGLVLGQVKTAAKSNEITAIPELLDALDVQGATVTIDAMGCQHAIIDKIVQKKADYIVAVKDNQPSLAQAVELLFDAGVGGVELTEDETIDKGHGRIDTRRCVVAHDLSAMPEQIRQSWTGLSHVVMVESTREVVNGKKKGEISTERRYYISSRQDSASEFNAKVRGHWSIENNCHWVLDVAFKEDESRTRKGDGAENLSILRRMALNLVKQEKSGKTSVRGKRLKAAWSPNYLQTLLGLKPMK